MLKAHHQTKHPRRPKYLQFLLLLFVVAYLGEVTPRPPSRSPAHPAYGAVLAQAGARPVSSRADKSWSCASALVPAPAGNGIRRVVTRVRRGLQSQTCSAWALEPCRGWRHPAAAEHTGAR